MPIPTRLRLAALPTPIEELPAGVLNPRTRILVKRDDLTGSVLSGNKVRKLEYALAEARATGADTVVTCGGVQSNHCRATAAAARLTGLRPVLILRGSADPPFRGNLFLDWLLGAEVRFIDRDAWASRDAIMETFRRDEADRGRRVYVIPEGASNAIGSLGYADAVGEALGQLDATGARPDAMVVAVGSAGTYAGLLAGAEIHGYGGRIVGIPVCDDAATFAARADLILDTMRERFLPGLRARGGDGLLLDGYRGRGYALSTPEELRTMRRIASTTGLVLDPVYTGKAFLGMIDALERGRLRGIETILFWHTGGLFGIFDKAAEWHSACDVRADGPP